jgi:protein-tyrosine phosphatase
MVTKILDHLYLGDLMDARKFKGEIICVMQDIPNAEPKEAYWIPAIRTKDVRIDYDKLIGEQDVEVTALKHQIDLVTFMTNKNAKLGVDTLIHCMAGIERSPLVVASYLHDYNGMTWNEAYDFIQEKRPEVANRLTWLNMTYDERTA